MCTYNVQPIITLLLLCFLHRIHMNLYKKNLLFRSHPRGLVHATAVSLVLIWRMWTTCKPKPYSSPPPPPPPYLSPVPDQGHQESRGGEGEGSLLVISCLLCSDRILPWLWPIKHTSLLCHIWWVTLLWREHPCRSPRAKDVPASRQQRSLGRGGGGERGLPRRGDEAWGGGGRAGKRMCCIWNTSSLREFTGPLHLNPTHISFWIAAIINTLVIRSSLKDCQSMKKECTLAWHSFKHLILESRCKVTLASNWYDTVFRKCLFKSFLSKQIIKWADVPFLCFHRLKTVEIENYRIKLQIWWVHMNCTYIL